MAQYDPALREETWVFQKIGESQGKPVYQRLKFNVVNYDGSVDGVLEPVSDVQFSTSSDIMLPTTDFGRIVKFELLETGQYFQDGVHRFD